MQVSLPTIRLNGKSELPFTALADPSQAANLPRIPHPAWIFMLKSKWNVVPIGVDFKLMDQPVTAP